RPRAFAAFRLMTSSTFSARSTGSSDGLAALEDLVDIGRGATVEVEDIRAVDHEPTRIHELAASVHGRGRYWAARVMIRGRSVFVKGPREWGGVPPGARQGIRPCPAGNRPPAEIARRSSRSTWPRVGSNCRGRVSQRRPRNTLELRKNCPPTLSARGF